MRAPEAAEKISLISLTTLAPVDDPTWGRTALQFANQIAVAQVYTEVLLQNTTHLPALRDVLAPVTPQTDVNSQGAIVTLIGQAWLDGVGA
jgi:hypothetical protein